ncbi:MAG: hypothetical protein JXQ99_18000 [Hyphomicrobiaceae bacterium]
MISGSIFQVVRRERTVSSQQPKIDKKLRAALDAIDQTRLRFDQAIRNGDEAAAADLLKTINDLAQDFDQLTGDNPTQTKG